MNDDYLVLSDSLPYEEATRYNQPPHKLVKLLPLGLVHSQKGDFLVDNESFQCIRDKFNERQLQIPIDYEHQTLKDMQAPAAGWIKNIVLKSDGIYGAVDWTERASEYLKNREYRYLSPVILTRSKDRKVVELFSAALTNTPAIDAMTPIVNSNKPSVEEPPPDEAEVSDGGTLETLIELLQLDPTATMEEVYKAVSTLLAGQEALKLKANAYQFEIKKLKADVVVVEAMKAGKVLPFQQDWAFQSAMNDPDGFALWLKSAPQVVPMGEMRCDPKAREQRPRSKSHELMGLSAEDVAKYGKI